MADGWTTADLDTLRKSIRRDVRKVKYEDREEEYRTLRDMKALEREAEVALGLRTPGPIRRVGIANKGLGRGPETGWTENCGWWTP